MMTTHNPTIFVVDDDPVLLFVLRGILADAKYRVETFEGPAELLKRLTVNERGCIVIDLRMPELDGLEVQRVLLNRGITLPLIFISGRAEVAEAVAAMKGGAVDFLSKPIQQTELCAVVEKALQKDAEIAAKSSSRDLARTRWLRLSARERDICRLLAGGLADKQIAAELGTAPVTVQAQRTRALQKLEVGSVPDLVRLMVHLGDGDHG